MISNAQRLNAAVAIALTNTDFMGNTPKVNKAIEALTPRDDVTRVFKMLQGNALKDYLVNVDKGKAVDSVPAKADWIRKYVSGKFEKHMSDPNTSDKASKMFNDAYPTELAVAVEEEKLEED